MGRRSDRPQATLRRRPEKLELEIGRLALLWFECMSYRESILVYHPLDIKRYLVMVQAEYGARPNPHEPGSFLIDTPVLPFYRPLRLEEYVSILSFNYLPLSGLLVLALAMHPELAPASTLVRWTAEQDLIMRGTVGILGQRLMR